MSKLLEIKNLNVVLDGHIVHNNLSFSVNEGDTITILGPNGSGKSVLLKAILGILPFNGEIIWNKKVSIGYLPQNLNQQAIKGMPLTVKDIFDLKEPVHKTDEVIKSLKLVGLDAKFLFKNAYTLSGGQFQRMLIAWVLIDNPQVVFLDEPTSGIDIGGGENLYSLLHKLQQTQKLTIFLVTHDVSIVYKYSKKVLCLSQKKHLCFGEPKSILTPNMLEQVFGMEIKLYDHPAKNL
jgi:zinc transport system ATP-binding protein